MTNTNNTTNNNYSSNQNVSDKHLSYFNQSDQTIQPNQNPVPVNQTSPNPVRIPQPLPQNQQVQQSPRPTNPAPVQNPQQVVRPRVATPPQTQPLPQIQQPKPVQVQKPLPQTPVQPQQNSQIKYINPTNINQTQVLQNMNDLKIRALDANRNLPEEQKSLNAQHYEKLNQQARQITINTYEILKLCIYIVPGVQVFILLFKSINDPDVIWHAKQSLVTQAIWLTAYFILQNTGIPLISGAGFTIANIWNLFMIGVLIYAGYKAYIGQKWRIPVVSDIAITYIDGKS